MYGRLICMVVITALLSAFYPVQRTPAYVSVPGEDISNLLTNVFENNSWINLPEDQLKEYFNSIFVGDLADSMVLKTMEFRNYNRDWHHPARITEVKLQDRSSTQLTFEVEICWLSLDTGEDYPSFRTRDRESYKVVAVYTDRGLRIKELTRL